jgi:ring-1,2-phenylacetyl-CoA epoxidase subunit PaaE
LRALASSRSADDAAGGRARRRREWGLRTVTALDFHSLQIAAVRRETAEAISVVFRIPEALRDTFAWKPGQHLTLKTVLEGEEQRRTYSICSGPEDGSPRIAIKRVPGGRFSIWANDTLAAGQWMDVLPPAGRFILPEGDGGPRHILAFAAGAGITPIIAMVKHALEREREASVTLLYGNRTPQSILFSDELEDLKDRYLGRFTLLHCLSRSEEGGPPLLEGRITGEKVKSLVPKLLRLDDIAHVFLCGPGSMIKETRNALMSMGLPRDRIHHEFFAAGGGAYRQPPPAAGLAAGAATQAGSEVVAVLDGVRHSFLVPPGGHVVDAALAAGVRVPFSCRGGMCCTCRARLVEGAADMTINYSLEPWEIERGFILTCQAVPKSQRLVVDYDQM